MRGAFVKRFSARQRNLSGGRGAAHAVAARRDDGRLWSRRAKGGKVAQTGAFMTYFPSLSFRASMRGLAAAACLSLSGLGLSACSGQDGPVIEHKGAAPAEPSQTPQTPETPQSSEPAPLAAAELAAIQAMTIPSRRNQTEP